MESTAFHRDAFYHTAWSTLHSISMHGIHCIQSGCFGPCCINPLHSIMLHGIHCIQMRCILPHCMDYTAFTPNAWNPLHSMTLHGIHCIKSRCFWPCCKKSTAFNHAEGIHCIQSCCIKSTAFNWDAFYQAAWNPYIHHTAWTPLHTIGIHCATRHGILCIQSGCFGPCCIKSTAFNHAA